MSIGEFAHFFSVGIIVLLVSLFYRFFPPKSINPLYGFRTPITMKNQDVWRISNRYVADQLILAMIINLLVSFIAYFILPTSEFRNFFPFLIMLAGLGYAVLKSYNFVKQNFNPDGTRKEGCKLPAWAEVKEQPLSDQPVQIREDADENEGKTASKTTKYALAAAFILFFITEACLLYLYPRLPENIYIHFNLLGEPSPRTVSKQTGFWVMQAFLIIIWTVDIALLVKMKNTVLSLLMIIFLSAISVIMISVFLYNATGSFLVNPIITIIITILITLLVIVIAGRHKKTS
jgi:uncharacterized membrane protein